MCGEVRGVLRWKHQCRPYEKRTTLDVNIRNRDEATIRYTRVCNIRQVKSKQGSSEKAEWKWNEMRLRV